MGLVTANLRNQVRTEAGEPSITDCTPATLDDKIRYAARRVARRLRTKNPTTDATKLLTITTVAGQQSYELTALPLGADIVEIHYGPALPFAGAALFPGTSVHIDARPVIDSQGYGGSPYRRADRIIDNISRRRAEEEWRTDFLDGKVWLDPIPDAAGSFTVVYREAPKVDVEDVPDDAERAVVYFAAADVLRYLANRYRGVTTPIRGATSQLFDRTTQFEESARLLDAQAEQECAEILAD